MSNQQLLPASLTVLVAVALFVSSSSFSTPPSSSSFVFFAHAQTTAAPSTPAPATTATTAAPSGTSLPGGVTTASPALTAPPATSQTKAIIDLEFEKIAREDEQEYIRIISQELNVTRRRITFDQSASMLGYPFGEHVLVRVNIAPPGPGDANQASALDVRLSLLQIAQRQPQTAKPQTFQDMTIVNGALINDNAVYTYSVQTAWDVLYTLLIVAGGVAFLGNVAFVAYKFYRAHKFAKREAEMERKEKELESLRSQAQGHGTENQTAAATIAARALEAEGEDVQALNFDDDGDDEEALRELAQRIAKANKVDESMLDTRDLSTLNVPQMYQQQQYQQQQSGSFINGNPAAHPFDLNSGERPAGVNQAAMAQRSGSAASPPRQQNSKVMSFLDNISLPQESATTVALDFSKSMASHTEAAIEARKQPKSPAASSSTQQQKSGGGAAYSPSSAMGGSTPNAAMGGAPTAATPQQSKPLVHDEDL